MFNMINKYLTILVVSASTFGAPENVVEQKKLNVLPTQKKLINNDLTTSGSSYSHQYSNWGGNYPGGYGFSITGVGTIDDRSSGYDPTYNTLDGHENSIRNSQSGYGYNGVTGYDNVGSGYRGYGGNSGYSGYGDYSQSGYRPTGYSPVGYGNSGYGTTGQDVGDGYSYNAGYGGGNGGYGGYGGNGGLISYYGYNNPYYQGGGHLGYGYYNKKPGLGNIYSSGVTPSLVTGYRGYTRK